MSHFTPEHVAHLEAYHKALRDGTAHAPWKDEEWALQMGEDSTNTTLARDSPNKKGKGKARASTKSSPECAPLFLILRLFRRFVTDNSNP